MAKADTLTETEVAAVREVLEERARVMAAIEEHAGREPVVEEATPGRVVWFRHETIGGLVLPALVAATEDSLAAADQDLLFSNDWPAIRAEQADEEQGFGQRVHLILLYPGGRDPSFGKLGAPVRLAANAPRSSKGTPGTWDWPVRQ